VLDHLGCTARTDRSPSVRAASGLRIDVHLPAVDGERFSDAIETTIYRVVQEALTNVWKHASASTVSVILEREGDALRIIIEDDGQLRQRRRRGNAPCPLCSGERERLAIGRTLDIESNRADGDSTHIVPLPAWSRT
jgi:signal transduction histidine kinase